MRTILISILCSYTIVGFAQDDLPYTDFRRKAESFSRIYDKDIRKDLAAFTIGGIEESLNAQPLKQLPITSFASNSITYDSAQIAVTITAKPFDISHHKLTKEDKYVVKIDGKPFYGNYSKIPTTGFGSVKVRMGQDTIPIPESAFSDLFNPSFTYRDASGTLRSQDGVYLSPDKRRLYIYMLNRDDTGSYEVTWIIQDKKYFKRVIDYGFSK